MPTDLALPDLERPVHLRLTVLDPASPARVPLEVAVDAPGDTPFGQIRDRLESLTESSTFSVGGQVLRDTALLGREPLVRGATITTGDDHCASTSSASSGR